MGPHSILVQLLSHAQQVGAWLSLVDDPAAPQPLSHKLLIAPGRDGHLPQIFQLADTAVPDGMHRLTAAVRQQAVLLRDFLITGENELLIHLGRNPHRFLGIHESPHIFGRECSLSDLIIAGKLVGKCPGSLSHTLIGYRGENQMFLLQHPVIGQRILRDPVHHFFEKLRIIVHIEHHIFHAHKMHHHLGRNAVQAIHFHPHRQNIADGLGNGLKLRLGTLFIHTESSGLQLIIIILQIFHHRHEMVPHAFVSAHFCVLHMNLNVKQPEKGIIIHPKPVRRHPVIVKKLLILKIFIELLLHLPGKFPRTPQPVRQKLPLKGPCLQMDHGPLPPQGIVGVPLFDSSLIFLPVVELQLFFRQFPQDLSVFLRNPVVHRNPPPGFSQCNLPVTVWPSGFTVTFTGHPPPGERKRRCAHSPASGLLCLYLIYQLS